MVRSRHTYPRSGGGLLRTGYHDLRHHTTPHRVFKIDELTRLIASHLVVIRGRKSAVNLARVCRCLEEPVLNTLWEAQDSPHTLLKVLPEETWSIEGEPFPSEPVVRDLDLSLDLMLKFNIIQFRIVENPPPEAWNRVQRYASWMHGLDLGWMESALGKDTIRQLRLNSPAGGWFPVLRRLAWLPTESNLPCADLFFSPQSLISSLCLSCCVYAPPHNILPTVASIISRLSASTLQFLTVNIGPEIPQAPLTGPISAFVLRCGPSLTNFSSSIPLSDAAINHLIHLPT